MHRNRFLNAKISRLRRSFFAFVEYHKREIRIVYETKKMHPCRAPQAKILHIESSKTDVLPHEMGAAGEKNML